MHSFVAFFFNLFNCNLLAAFMRLLLQIELIDEPKKRKKKKRKEEEERSRNEI